MTKSERRQLAARRLAAVADGRNPYAQGTAQRPTHERSEDSAVDRGLIAWWG